MTKTEEVTTGMARKWERHFHGKWRIMARGCVASGIVLALVLALLWTQYLYVHVFNSWIAFNAIVDHEDMEHLHWTYLKFEHLDQPQGTRLFRVYLFHVKNPHDVVAEGSRPQLVEMGPYAYVEQIYKYDVTFSHDDSRLVTYKEWSYFEPPSEPSDCRLMYFRMGLAKYLSNRPDCRGHQCHCKDDTEKVTVVNGKFMSLLHRRTQHGLIGALGEQVFQTISSVFTARTGFQRSVKIDLAPELITSTFAYRKALQASVALDQTRRDMDKAHGPLGVSRAFIASASSDDDATDDGDDAVRSPVAFSAAAYVVAQGVALDCDDTVSLTMHDANWLLNASVTTSLLNMSVGAPLWIGAGRYLGLLERSLIAKRNDADGDDDRRAYNTLVNTTAELNGCAADDDLEGGRTVCEAKVRGLAYYLYDTDSWFGTSEVLALLLDEWRGASNATFQGCDAGAYRGGAFTEPIELPTLNGLFTYACNWQLGDYLDYYGQGAPPLNASIANMIVNEELDDSRNELSVLRDVNLVRWWQAYEYCNLTAAGEPTRCSGMSESEEMATSVIPLLFAQAEGREAEFTASDDDDGAESNSTTRRRDLATKYQGQVCAVAAWIADGWGGKDLWIEHYVADYINRRYTGEPYEFVAGKLEDLGYAQWGGGYITQILWKVPSVANLQRKGFWKFAPEQYQSGTPVYYSDGTYTETDMDAGPIEFISQATIIGYPSMNLSVPDAKLLLRLLSSTDVDSVEMRESMIKAHTTYYCDGSDGGKLGGVWYDGSCNHNDAYFIVQNVFANFSYSPSRYADDEEIPTLWKAVSTLLDTPFDSSPQQCSRIQQLYLDCVDLTDEEGYTDWIVNCGTWETIKSAPTLGIYCDTESILKINSPGFHDYVSFAPHPWQRKRGNVVATQMFEWVVLRILKEERIWCSDSVDCNYKKSGMFTEQRARDVIFEGYADPLAIKLLNRDLAPRNLTLRCVNRTVNYRTEYCQPIYTNDCTESGFEVLYRGDVTGFKDEVIMHVARRGENRAHWHSPEVKLPYGLGQFENPAFALYAGQMWKNSTFQKQRACAHRFLGGPKNLYNGCEIEINTGRHSLKSINEITKWYGNETLNSGENFLQDIVVEGTLGTQFEPELWEGFSEYQLPYLARYRGLRRSGNESLTVLAGDDMLLLRPLRWDLYMTPNGPVALEALPLYLNYPTYFEADVNESRALKIEINRYIVPRESWDAARHRAGWALRDSLGMPYRVPPAMGSLERRAGFPVFVSTPHHYGNADWGGKEYIRFTGLDTGTVYRKEHWYFIDVEPITGMAVRYAKRLQYAMRLERNSLFPYLLSIQSGCVVPTDNGFSTAEKEFYGCSSFFPAWWVSDEYVIDEPAAHALNDDFLAVPNTIYWAALIGSSGGTGLALLGSCVWWIQNKKERKFLTKIYID